MGGILQVGIERAPVGRDADPVVGEARGTEQRLARRHLLHIVSGAPRQEPSLPGVMGPLEAEINPVDVAVALVGELELHAPFSCRRPPAGL